MHNVTTSQERVAADCANDSDGSASGQTCNPRLQKSVRMGHTLPKISEVQDVEARDSFGFPYCNEHRNLGASRAGGAYSGRRSLRHNCRKPRYRRWPATTHAKAG